MTKGVKHLFVATVACSNPSRNTAKRRIADTGEEFKDFEYIDVEDGMIAVFADDMADAVKQLKGFDIQKIEHKGLGLQE